LADTCRSNRGARHYSTAVLAAGVAAVCYRTLRWGSAHEALLLGLIGTGFGIIAICLAIPWQTRTLALDTRRRGIARGARLEHGSFDELTAVAIDAQSQRRPIAAG
jgi:hypothetical protein